MDRREKIERILHETLIFLGVLFLLALVFRFWVTISSISIGIVIVVICLFITGLNSEGKSPQPLSVTDMLMKKEYTETEIKDYAFSLIQKRITELVLTDYPDAKWIWEKPNARSLIEEGNEVFIILNHAAGFCRAKVNVRGFGIRSLDYMTVQSQEKPSETEVCERTDILDAKHSSENYELLAFEWTEAHTIEINRRCNELLGTGGEHLMLTAEELPLREAWPCICRELERSGLSEVFCTDHGIQINFTQRFAERE